MRKNYLFGLSAMAAVMLMTSCQEEDVVKQAQEANAVTVSINVSTPELGVATRAFGDGYTAMDLHYAVYNVQTKDGKEVLTYLSELTREDHEINGKTTVDLQLVTGNTYKVIFWADNEGAPYATNWEDVENPTVTIDYSNVSSNQEIYDAFFNWMSINVDAAKTVEIDLFRPFAQLNIGTRDIVEASKAGYTLKQTQVKVKAYQTLNLWDKTVADMTDVVVDFQATDYPNFDENANYKLMSSDAEGYEAFPVTGYEYMAMNYLLRPVDKELEDVEFLFYSTEGELKERKYASVPFQRNWRTNIYGQLITSDVDVMVEIVPGFDGAHNREVWDGHTLTEPQIVDGIVRVGQGAELAYIANVLNGGGQSNAEYTRSGEFNYKTATIELTNNIDLGGENWNPIKGFEGKFDGKGYTISNLYVRTEGKDAAGLFASAKFVSNLKVKDADIQGHYKTGVIVGNGLCARIVNCHVENAKVLVTPYNNDDANHVGGIVGYLSAENEAYVKDCSVKNAEITGYRDVAGIAGTANQASVVTGNLVENVTVTADQNCEYVEEKASNAGAIVGRVHEKATVEGNTEGENVNVIVKGISSADLKSLVSEEGAVVNLGAGTYTFQTLAAGVTLICEEGTVFEGNSKLNINGATVIGATFSNPSGNAVDQTINGTFINCTFTGSNALRYAYAGETCVFENCVFDGAVYGAHFDGGANDILFKNCIFSGFNAFAAAIELVTFDGCTFKANGKGNYNGANLWGSAKMIDTKFEFDGSVEYEWIDAISNEKTYEFTRCTLNGGSIFNSEYIFSRSVGTKITIDGVEYTWAEGDYLVSENGAVVTSAAALTAALKAKQAKIVLMDGTYEGLFDLTGIENASIVAAEGANPTINGMVWANNTTATLKGLTLSNPNGVQHPNTSNSQYFTTINNQYPLVGAYLNANIKLEECTLNIVGPTVYGFYGYAANSPEFVNCTFNCNKIRPIANNGPAITVTGCTFNDPYHYAVRIFENSEELQTVVFTNNIVQGANDKGEFEGINISKKGGTATVYGDFTITGNTAELKYRHHANVTMAESCTYSTDIEGFAFEKED